MAGKQINNFVFRKQSPIVESSLSSKELSLDEEFKFHLIDGALKTTMFKKSS